MSITGGTIFEVAKFNEAIFSSKKSVIVAWAMGLIWAVACIRVVIACVEKSSVAAA